LVFNNYWARNIQKSNVEFVKNELKRESNKKYSNHLDTKNFAIKKVLLKNLQFNSNLKSMEDFDLYLRLKEKIKIRFIDSIIVKHLHKTSMASWFRTQVDRAYSTAQIYANIKIDKKKTLCKEKMFESLRFRNWLFFPFWLILQLFKRPQEFLFVVVSEVGWRVGIIKYYLGKFRN
jgi:hypothetical protein